MNNIVFINACSWNDYMAWQEEVLITNFRKFGVSDRMHILVWHPKQGYDLSYWKRLEEKYPEVKFFYYEDKGVQLHIYLPQLRPHILARHFDEHPHLSQKTIFYHDNDIIFNRLPDFDFLCKEDICWQSDTSSYLQYTYIIEKEAKGNIPNNEALNLFAQIGKISPEIIKFYDKKTGGAQYILKGIDGDFWRDVERMSLDIMLRFHYAFEDSVNRRYFPSEDEGFQSWCADMWAVNFSLWNRGKQTALTKELDFSWATDNLEAFYRKPIYHNAGCITHPTPPNNIFYKGGWIDESPIGSDKLIMPAEGTASREYVKAILEVTP